MTKDKVILPMVPSKLLTIALRDLIATEKQEDEYHVDMNFWHDTSCSEERCFVCMAGAVMAQSLHMDIAQDLEPGDSPENTNQLFAINCLRAGRIAAAFEFLGLPFPEELERNWPIVPYDDPTLFKKTIRSFISRLQALGH